MDTSSRLSWLACSLMLRIYFFIGDTLAVDPMFDVPLVNVTVVEGQTAELPCSIRNLGKYKVTWINQEFFPLTFEDRRIVDDSRFSIVRPYIDEWNLQINDVKFSDNGTYKCQINKDPVISKIVILHVRVPPKFHFCSGDVVVQEGETVVLFCNATGVPKPTISWGRMSPRRIIQQGGGQLKQCKVGIELTGEILVIPNVSRNCDDIYEAIGSNGVSHDLSRRLKVTVEFAPEVRMPNINIKQKLGLETILECNITAYPLALTSWYKKGKEIHNSHKHRTEVYSQSISAMSFNLLIKNIEPNDYGEYTCVAKNPHGVGEGKTELKPTDECSTSNTQQTDVYNRQLSVRLSDSNAKSRNLPGDASENYEKDKSQKEASVNILPEAIEIWRQAREAFSSSEKSFIRSEHFKTLIQRDTIPAWAMGLEPVPQFLVPDSQKDRIINIVKEHGIIMLVEISRILEEKSNDSTRGEALLGSVEHIYKRNQHGGFNEAANLLARLVNCDRLSFNTSLKKHETDLASSRIDNQTITRHLFQGRNIPKSPRRGFQGRHGPPDSRRGPPGSHPRPSRRDCSRSPRQQGRRRNRRKTPGPKIRNRKPSNRYQTKLQIK